MSPALMAGYNISVLSLAWEALSIPQEGDLPVWTLHILLVELPGYPVHTSEYLFLPGALIEEWGKTLHPNYLVLRRGWFGAMGTVSIFTIKRGAKKLLRVSQLDGQRTTHFSRYMPLLINSINYDYDMFGVPKFDPFPCMRRIDEFLWQFLRIQWWGDHVNSFFWFLPSEHHGHPSPGQNLINLLLFTASVWSCYFGRCSSPILRWTLIF